MDLQQEVLFKVPRYPSMRAYREARRSASLDPAETYTGAQLRCLYLRRSNTEHESEHRRRCDPSAFRSHRLLPPLVPPGEPGDATNSSDGRIGRQMQPGG